MVSLLHRATITSAARESTVVISQRLQSQHRATYRSRPRRCRRGNHSCHHSADWRQRTCRRRSWTRHCRKLLAATASLSALRHTDTHTHTHQPQRHRQLCVLSRPSVDLVHGHHQRRISDKDESTPAGTGYIFHRGHLARLRVSLWWFSLFLSLAPFQSKSLKLSPGAFPPTPYSGDPACRSHACIMPTHERPAPASPESVPVFTKKRQEQTT